MNEVTNPKMKPANQNEKVRRGRGSLINDFSNSRNTLAASPAMQGQPTGIQPKPGLAKSRSRMRTRLLGGSALGSGTRVTRTDAGSIVRPCTGVAWVQILQANVSLYGNACGGGPTISMSDKVFDSSCHQVWTQNSISGLLATAESVIAAKP